MTIQYLYVAACLWIKHLLLFHGSRVFQRWFPLIILFVYIVCCHSEMHNIYMAGLVIYCGNNRFPCFLFAYCSPLFVCFRVRLIIHTTLSISLVYNNAVDLHIQNVSNEDKTLFFFLTCSMYRERILKKIDFEFSAEWCAF